MLRTFFWYAAGWTYLLVTMPALMRVKYLQKRGRLTERDKFANSFSMMLARGLFYLTGSTVEVMGIENIPEDCPVLFVSNHQSHMDSAIIHGFIKTPKGFIADKEVKNIPILRAWMKHIKCIFIDRDEKRNNIRSMEDSLRILQEGHSMVIYPEWKLVDRELPGSFKKGFVKLAVKAEVPIVPVTMVNSFRVMSRKGTQIRSVSVKCIISQPVYIAASEQNDENRLANKIKNIIAEQLK